MFLKNLRQDDKLILACTLTLLGFGLVMVYSASSVFALKWYGDPAYFLKRQSVWALLGLGAMLTVWKMDYRRLRYFSLPVLGILFVLLVLVLVPGIGAEINGSRRWVRLAGLSLQPSEFVKVALLTFIAASLAKRWEKLPDFFYGLGPYMALTGTFMFFIALEPDLGTAAALGAVVFFMLLFAGARPAHLFGLVLAATPLLYHELFGVGYRRGRLSVYMDPWSDPLGAGFQIIQSFLAFGGGGLTGLGLGEGRQKLLFLPEPHSDFIFSVIGEEFGLIGAMGVLVLFALISFCGIRLALKCQDDFGRFLAFGVTVMLGIQAIINMGVATGLFPNKGMPLPFISAGGSALFVSLLSVGVLLSIARAQKGPTPRRA
jgi:cell division protein FtsW